MAWQSKGLSEWHQLIRQDFNARMPGADSLLWTSIIGVTAVVLAGLAYTIQGFIDWVARMVHPITAEGEWLARWGVLVGVFQKPATHSSGYITVTGVAGSIVEAGRVLQAGGITYTTQEPPVTLVAGSAQVAVKSDVTGAATNVLAGATLTFQSPPAGVQAATVVAAGGITGGADIEDEASYHARIEAEFQEPAHGGNDDDYKRWAKEVPGVTRVWVKGRSPSPGAVTVFFMMDDVRATFHGFPQGSNAYPFNGDQRLIFDHIQGERPVTAQVFTISPTPKPILFTIQGLTPNTPDVQAAIAAELDDLLFRQGEPGGTIPWSNIWEAISRATGERKHVLVSPPGDIVCGPGELPYVSDINHLP